MIVSLYDTLMAIRPSPVVALGRAIAIAQDEGAARGLAEIAAITDAYRLADYPFYFAALGELEHQRGNAEPWRASTSSVQARVQEIRWSVISSNGARAKSMAKTLSLFFSLTSDARLMALAEDAPPPWRRLIARLDPRAYLTLHIVVGLGVCLLTGFIFAVLLDSVREHDVLVTRDQAVANWFHGNGTALGDQIFVIISAIGSPAAMAVLFAAVVLYLWRAKQRTLLVAWVLSYVGGTVLDGVIKDIVRRPRPEFAAKFLHYSSWSFPSGHSMGSLIGFAMLAYTIIRVGKSRACPPE